MATDNKKFYKTVFTVTVLSDKPVNHREIRDIADEIETGDCSGDVKVEHVDTVTKRQMALELHRQNSDPTFLLGEDGWKYALQQGDEITVNADGQPHVRGIIRSIEYSEPFDSEDYVTIITTDNVHVTAFVKELS